MNVKSYEAFVIKTFLLILLAGIAYADGTVSDDIRISSDVLGYDLQYHIYLPENYESRADHPVIFLTDGQNYIRRGNMPSVLNRLIGNGKIQPVIAVFVDARDPDNLESNRRRNQFFCNEDYLNFYIDELIPSLEKKYPVIKNREGRTIMGLSFGGLNAACFGMLGHDIFSGIAMQSPANHPVPNLLPTYQEMPTLPLRMFLSTGTPNDNTPANRNFHAVLKAKGYDMKYIEVPEGHNWDNWGPLIDDALIYYYGTENYKFDE
ncbi:MAG: enterochelin esterase-like enzyme [Gammaproteobacteria bacterium]|jgi:enterochelin esterase-like enzyme